MALDSYLYKWPASELVAERWSATERMLTRKLPESDDELRQDSRWPAFFPSPMCIVTTTDGIVSAVEKLVGPSIVNRFPYVVALSFCRTDLSDRHHARRQFMELLERGRVATVQFLAPGQVLDRVMEVITTTDDALTTQRLAMAGVPLKESSTGGAPVLSDAYLAYQGRLVEPSSDIDGTPIFLQPWRDVGSHRVYFVEITSIALKESIVRGDQYIYWKSLPTWQASTQDGLLDPAEFDQSQQIKGYNPHYRFPSAETVTFHAERFEDGMGLLFPRQQVAADLRQLSNDEARWPCYFPSSVGMITTWAEDGRPTLMPCGSTTVVSRQPMIVATAVSYARINARYSPRATLDMIRHAGVFGCGVPYLDPRIVNAITYSGNVSFSSDPDKLEHAGLGFERGEYVPLLPALPVTFECVLVGEELLGTHALFFGEVRRVSIRVDLAVENPLEWCPWADVVTTNGT